MEVVSSETGTVGRRGSERGGAIYCEKYRENYRENYRELKQRVAKRRW